MFSIETTLIYIIWTHYRVVDEMGQVYEGGTNIPNRLYIDIYPMREGQNPRITERWIPIEQITVNRLINMGIKPTQNPGKN